jgi:hypothetical protein
VILYYALGGGLGHITRARRVLAELGCADRATVLTASPYALDPRVTEGLPVLHVPVRLGRDREAFRGWLYAALARLQPDELVVDSFPGGIIGELCGMALPPARHVARRLRWRAYAQRLHGPLPRFEATHVLEPLSEPHARVLEECSRRLEPLELTTVPGASSLVGEHPHWLVVHSGPDEELIELVGYAAERRTGAEIVVVSPRPPSWLPEGSQWRDIYPVGPHLAAAERIVTAAGFNLMNETAPLRERHHFIPFPRPLDDQFARSAAAAMRHLPLARRARSVTLPA